jgi:hypothetical protein
MCENVGHYAVYPISPDSSSDCSPKKTDSECSAKSATRPELHRVVATFTQEGNSMGTTGDPEILDVFLEFQLSEEDGPFFVLRSETGWSFDSPEELLAVINRVSDIMSD